MEPCPTPSSPTQPLFHPVPPCARRARGRHQRHVTPRALVDRTSRSPRRRCGDRDPVLRRLPLGSAPGAQRVAELDLSDRARPRDRRPRDAKWAPPSRSSARATSPPSAAWSTRASTARRARAGLEQYCEKGNIQTYNVPDPHPRRPDVRRLLREHHGQGVVHAEGAGRASTSPRRRRCCAPASPPTRRCGTGTSAPARRSASSASAASATWA